MSPRCLIFSSDQETSGRLTEALQELDFLVDACPEIFSSIEKLTTHSYEMIVADWNDPVEAAFLLKTARELKSNCDAFTLMVAHKADSVLARQAGANLMMTKPVLAGHVKYGLLASTVFPAALRAKLPARSLQTMSVIAASSATERRPMPAMPIAPPAPVSVAGPPAPVRNSYREDPSPALNLTVPRHEPVSRAAVAPAAAAAALKQSRPRYSYLLWGSTLGAGLAAAYILSAPLRTHADPRAALPAQVRLAAVASIQPSALKARHDETPHNQESPAPENIKVRPASQIETARLDVPPKSPAPTPEFTRVPEELEMIPVEQSRTIPASLRSAPSDGNVSAVDPRTMNSPLAQADPVSLSEDLASTMLLQKVQPSYPEQAMRAGLQGAVVLQAFIRKDGTISNLKLVRGPLLLRQAAYKAVRQWRYKPYLLNGQFVEAQTYVTVNFRLP